MFKKFIMRRFLYLFSLMGLCLVLLLAACGSSQPAPTVVPTHQPVATTAPSTPITPTVVPSTTTKTVPVVQSAAPNTPSAPNTPVVVHLQVGAGVQLAHFYVTVTRAELKTVQTPPKGMTYLLVTATLRNTTNVNRPLYAANFILHDAKGKAYFAHVYSGAPAPPYGVVKPGATVLGPLVYLVPISQGYYTFTYQWTGGLAQANWDVVV